MRRFLPFLILTCIACAGSPAETTLTTTTTTAPATTEGPTTTEAVTTTTEPLPPSPINGMPVSDPRALDRRVIAVKIDNHPNARPQSGLDLAEAVIEVPVEGLTRFIALFHSTDAEFLGPVRSGRPSDGRLLNPLNATMAISGGQDWVISGLRAEVEGIIGEQRPAMFRIDGRRAPHDLYTNTEALREIADERDYSDEPPTELYTFGQMPRSAERASQVVMNFGNSFLVTWDYDPVARSYARTHAGSASEALDIDGESYEITADSLVVIIARRYTEQAPAGQTSVPAMDTVGTGTAYVFSQGGVLEGTWARESSEGHLILTDLNGDPMTVPPGYLWISIVPEQNGISFE
ncbi:MAG TPA: DUF3048 domain-containing protein [Acidimicrobiia bacterium]|nr:DUF3048 domain-containing protein [Acidimicrobiia bacterium]